jgi:hypothetical protein
MTALPGLNPAFAALSDVRPILLVLVAPRVPNRVGGRAYQSGGTLPDCPASTARSPGIVILGNVQQMCTMDLCVCCTFPAGQMSRLSPRAWRRLRMRKTWRPY